MTKAVESFDSAAFVCQRRHIAISQCGFFDRLSAIAGYLSEQAPGSIQDFFVDAFTVRPGTYTSIQCQYERNFKVLFFFPGIEVHSYELRIYPDYCEVWYSYLYSGFESTITLQQKVGEMTLSELEIALEGQ